jgi:cytochrome c
MSIKKALVLVACVLSASAPVRADLALARSKNCMSCHAVERKVLGPAFKDVAARYKGNAAATELLATKIRKGGAGVWGPVPMPANNQVSEAEARTLATWVLATPQ